jgi:hypothetical protein
MVNVPIWLHATTGKCLDALRKSYEEPRKARKSFEEPRQSRLPLCALELRLSFTTGQRRMLFNFECAVRLSFADFKQYIYRADCLRACSCCGHSLLIDQLRVHC